MRKRKNNQASRVLQRYMRGYLAKKKVMKELAELKLNICYDYFQEIRRWRELCAQIRIAYHWRRYARIIRLQELAYNEAKARGKKMKQPVRGARNPTI